ncbi:MAG: hypothetical protein ACRDK2_01910, partial [Solirubrobacteraceae bacterium]
GAHHAALSLRTVPFFPTSQSLGLARAVKSDRRSRAAHALERLQTLIVGRSGPCSGPVNRMIT